MRELVGADHQRRADDAFDQPRGSGDTPLTTDDAGEVHVRVQHLARRRADGGALEQNLLEAHRQDQPQAQDEQQHRDAQQARQGNAPQSLPASGPVDDRGLVERRVDAQQRRQVNDGGVAGFPPDQLSGHQRFEEPWFGHDVDGWQTEVAQGVDEDARTTQHLLPQRDDDHPRNEVGQIDDVLNDAANPRADDPVQHQRQADRRREVKDDLQQGDDDRVRRGLPECLSAEHRLKVGEADERAFGDAEERQVILERDDVAEQRQIAEEDEVEHARQDEQQHDPVAPDPLPDARTGRRGWPDTCAAKRRGSLIDVNGAHVRMRRF